MDDNQQHDGLLDRKAALPRSLAALANDIKAEQITWLMKTATRVDVGSWFFKRRLWVCATDLRLYLLANGPRPYTKKLDYCGIKHQVYNHVTGDLTFKSVDDELVTLKMSPSEGYDLLKIIDTRIKKGE